MVYGDSRIVDDLPFDRFEPWTLAGCNSFGVIYAISVDEALFKITLKITLWNYNNIQRTWKVLLVSDLPSPRWLSGYNNFVSAIYNEELGRVDVFMGSGSTSYILRFITIPTPKLENVFSAADDMRFRGAYQPSLHCIGEQLFVIPGTMALRGFRGVFRIFQVAVNEESNKFTLLPVWNSCQLSVYSSSQVVTFGTRLLMMESGAKVLCFNPNLGGGITQWPEPTVATYPWTSGQILRNALCRSVSSSDTYWIIPYLGRITEVIVAADGELQESRVLDRTTLGDDGVYCTGRSGKYVAASSTHVFWVPNNLPAIASVQVNVPTLQYLCLSKLCSTMEAYRQCKSEEEALRLGIPILAWRRYCK